MISLIRNLISLIRNLISLIRNLISLIRNLISLIRNHSTPDKVSAGVNASLTDPVRNVAENS
jgi:hypothetical protein